MQLRLSLPVSRLGSSLFKQSTSAILTGVTIAGAFATVIFNSTTSRNSVNEAFDKFASLLQKSSFGSGINKLGETFKDWGTTIVGKKDDFVQWVDDYLNVSGFKSGAVELYRKLYDWAEIVYNWFKDKFIIFIKNIPEMVQNWKKLRLSLFKWGTFLGGGGGSALWAMFGSGDNWGKLAELIGNPEYAGLLEKFSTLVEKNGDAFAGMTAEEAQEMLEGILDDPQEAEELLDELNKEQEEENKKNKEELEKQGKEQEKEVELKKERILEQLSNQKAGKPKDPQEALGGFIGAGLGAILKDGKRFDSDPFSISRKAFKEYMAHLEKESKGKSKSAEVKKHFLETVGNSKEQLVNTFAQLSANAYKIYKELQQSNPENPERFGKIFENVMKEEFTQAAKEGEQGDAQGIDGIVKLDLKPKKK